MGFFAVSARSLSRHGTRRETLHLPERTGLQCPQRKNPMFTNSNRYSVKALLIALVTLGAGSAVMAAPQASSSPGDYTVLAGTAVTCTDTSVTGDVGVSPGTAITQTNCSIDGTTHAGDAS